MPTLIPAKALSPLSAAHVQLLARNPYAWQRTSLVQDLLFKALLIVAPIQSVLVTPVQGTTPAAVLLFLSLGLLASGDIRYRKLWIFTIGFTLLYTVYLTFSLSSYYIDTPDTSRITIIREVFLFGWVRQSHVTQGFYLLVPCVFCYMIYLYYQEAFIKYIYYGLIILSLYGFYEFIFFAIFHANGDFLSNRNFGDLDSASTGAGTGEAGFATGSLVQISNVFGAGFMRLKSLVGEPSMYALTVTPFTVYAFARRWWLLFGILLLSLLLGSSTTAILGLAIGMGYAHARERSEAVLYVGAVLFIGVLLYFTIGSVQEVMNKLLFDKLDSDSGTERVQLFINHASVVFDGNFLRTLFGLGFGTARSTDMLSNLLANVGVIGFLFYSTIMLAPCYLMKKGEDTSAIISALLAIYVMEMATVSEYAYLPPWFMVALGYVRAREQRSAPVLSGTFRSPGRGLAA